MTNGRAFVDTNILLRATLPPMPLHKEAASLISQMWENDTELWISRQVLREYIGQVTRPQVFMTALTIAEVLEQLIKLQSLFRIADDTSAVTEQLVKLIQAYPTGGKQIHDANIVATMHVNNIDTLLTGNIADMRRFQDTITLIDLVAD